MCMYIYGADKKPVCIDMMLDAITYVDKLQLTTTDVDKQVRSECEQSRRVYMEILTSTPYHEDAQCDYTGHPSLDDEDTTVRLLRQCMYAQMAAGATSDWDDSWSWKQDMLEAKQQLAAMGYYTLHLDSPIWEQQINRIAKQLY